MKKNKILIIAEAGVNHNGDYKTACKLIDKASEVGADIIKFQSFVTDELIIKKGEKAEYQKKLTNLNENQFEMLKKLEISFKFQKKISFYCKKKKIEFLTSPFDLKSLNFINKLKLKRIKIPSGEITNLPFLKSIGKLNKKIILSTGMSNLKEINEAIKILIKSGTKKNNITILHCTSSYPTIMKEVNLNAMLTIKNKFNLQIGYSDHTKGIVIPIAAAALGAKIIEKHLTLNNNLKGPDHSSSLEPKEFKNMITAIRDIELAMGDGKKQPTKSEITNIKKIRKSIYAKKYIKKNERFTSKNLTTKRPAKGLSPMNWDKLINKISKKNYKIDDLIK